MCRKDVIMDKLNIAILFGGCSSEYSVSLESAHAVITHLDRTRYTPMLIGISPSGDWYYFTGDVEKIRLDTWNNPTDCGCQAAESESGWTPHFLFFMAETGRTERYKVFLNWRVFRWWAAAS